MLLVLEEMAVIKTQTHTVTGVNNCQTGSSYKITYLLSRLILSIKSIQNKLSLPEEQPGIPGVSFLINNTFSTNY